MRNGNKIIAGLGIAITGLLAAWLLREIDLFEKIQLNLSHALYKERPVHEDILIVAIDDASLASESLGGLGAIKNWTRKTYAEAVENIEEGSPTVVMLDILFSSASDGLSGEEILETAKEYPYVQDFAGEVLRYLDSPHPQDEALTKVFSQHENIYLLKNPAGEVHFNGTSFEYPAQVLPFQTFQELTHQGFTNTITSEDSTNLSTIYSIPTLLKVAGVEEEHMDLKLARTYLKQETAFEIPTEQGQMLINYAQKPYGFPSVSFADVVNGKIDPKQFEGKIVLVGATASILQDRHFTPIDALVPMPGIEIHANAIQTLLEGAYLQNQSTASFLLVTALLLFGVAGFLMLPVIPGALLLLAELVAFPFYAQWSFNRGVVPDLIWPVFALTLAYFASLAYRNFAEFREKRKLKSAFSHYVSPDLVEQISQNPQELKLGGDRREITALFLDIENFTTLSEKLEPQEVVRIINHTFDGLANVIMAHEGTVDKFEGDAIMALFGAPLPNPDHAQKACEAALELQEKMQSLNAETGHNLKIRVGLATGEAIVGNMGSESRFDYTAMGDTVNTASRLEGGNKFYGTRILVTAQTMEATKDVLSFRPIDRVRFKGKDQAVDIYEVLGHKENLSPEGAAFLGEWSAALESYRMQSWSEASQKFHAILEKLPEDGPTKTYLERIEKLQENPIANWDGSWTFDQK